MLYIGNETKILQPAPVYFDNSIKLDRFMSQAQNNKPKTTYNM